MDNTDTQKVIDSAALEEVLRIKRKEAELERMSKVKIKEYDEIQCNRESCRKVFPVEGNTIMKDGRHGICTCPHCGKAVRAVKTRPSEKDYNRLPTGQRIRKIPKDGLTKKQRKKARKEALCRKQKQ